MPDSVPSVYVRFIDPSLDDLRTLHRKDPQIAREVLKKCLLLERSPEAGAPLLGDLIGARKLVVGNRHWRMVWRVTSDGSIEIAEVWAAGTREDDRVYDEVRRRIAAMPENPTTNAFRDVVDMPAAAGHVHPTKERTPDPVPDWLQTRLIHTVGMSAAEVEELTGAEAIQLWEHHLIRGQHDE